MQEDLNKHPELQPNTSVNLEAMKEQSSSSSQNNSHRKHKSKTKHQEKGKRLKDGSSYVERIPHLVKQKAFKKSEMEEQLENHKSSDEYVLERLFKKSGRLCHSSLNI